jgi:hypothetical protein
LWGSDFAALFDIALMWSVSKENMVRKEERSFSREAQEVSREKRLLALL